MKNDKLQVLKVENKENDIYFTVHTFCSMKNASNMVRFPMPIP